MKWLLGDPALVGVAGEGELGDAGEGVTVSRSPARLILDISFEQSRLSVKICRNISVCIKQCGRL